jgi:hypothetical protein
MGIEWVLLTSHHRAGAGVWISRGRIFAQGVYRVLKTAN